MPKASNFTSGGVQNRDTKNRRLETIVTSIQDSKPREKQTFPTFSYFLMNNALLYNFLGNWLAHNKKMTEKSVFRKAWSPEMTSQSLPVSCFWPRGFVPHRKWNLTLLVHQNTGKENRYRKCFFPILISTYQYCNLYILRLAPAAGRAAKRSSISNPYMGNKRKPMSWFSHGYHG